MKGNAKAVIRKCNTIWKETYITRLEKSYPRSNGRWHSTVWTPP